MENNEFKDIPFYYYGSQLKFKDKSVNKIYDALNTLAQHFDKQNEYKITEGHQCECGNYTEDERVLVKECDESKVITVLTKILLDQNEHFQEPMKQYFILDPIFRSSK